VVVVDADNPVHEIYDHFVWQDEHERVVAEAHKPGYQAGYQAACVRVRQRPSRVISRGGVR